MFSRAKKDENPEFEAGWNEYKETVDSLKKLNDLINSHLEITGKYVASCAEVSLQVARFFKSSEPKVSMRTRAYGQLNAEIERLQLRSVQKLYKQEIEESFQVLWNQDQQIHDSVKERKKLIAQEKTAKKNMNSKRNEYEKAQEAERKALELNKPDKRGRGLGRRRKSLGELNLEVNEKTKLYQTAVQNKDRATKQLIKKFNSMAQSKNLGDLISSPVSVIIASHYHLAYETLIRLEESRKHFQEHYAYLEIARQFDLMQLNGLVIEKDVKRSKGFVFGRRLVLSTPDVVCDCMAYIREGLKTEGLFRIPGNRNNVEKIQACYDRNDKYALNDFRDIDIHDVCSTLKQYFNLMPEPLIPYEAYDRLESYFQSNTGNIRKEDIIAICREIGPPRNGLLGMLLNFLRDISKKQQYNQMTSGNLATCFAPVLLKPQPTVATGENGGTDVNLAALRSVKNLASSILIMTYLIDCAREFGVPTDELVLQHTNVTAETKQRVNQQSEADYMERERKRGHTMPGIQLDLNDPPRQEEAANSDVRRGMPRNMMSNLVPEVQANLNDPEMLNSTLGRGGSSRRAKIARDTGPPIPPTYPVQSQGDSPPPVPPPRTPVNRSEEDEQLGGSPSNLGV